jgi:sialate O-acetylesterase
MNIHRALGIMALSISAPSLAAHANLDVPAIFGDHAVLQRDMPMRLWGWGTPGTEVGVTFDAHQARATVAADGRWQVTLPAHAAGGPYAWQVSDGKQTLTSHDVLVGDVYLASGQSNMEFELAKARDGAAEVARATDGSIRELKIPNAWAVKPSARLPGGDWVPASPATAGKFSAVAYFFAREIRADQHVPVGIINSSWGGSRIEPWMDAATAQVQPSAVAARVAEEDAAEAKLVAATRHRLQRWPGVLDAGSDGDYSRVDADEHDFVRIKVPDFWESQGYVDMDGVAWYRTHLTLGHDDATAGITLGLGMIDDSDTTYVNGVVVGNTVDAWNGVRTYRVPATALHEGDNVVAIKVDDLGAGGGIHGEAAQLFVEGATGARRLITGPWLFRPTRVALVPAQTKNQVPTLLYNAMIHPLLPANLRGVLWYQGEQNATDDLAYGYRQQFAALIGQWRAQFGQPALPFLFVQLANFKRGTDMPDGSPWATLRESQAWALRLPATAQAVTIDVGNPDNIHPTDKQTVGHRLALAARHVVYGQSLVYRGPTLASVAFDGDLARLRFDNGGAALATRGNASLSGFTVAGADRHFQPATARIDGQVIVVQANGVTAPSAVRYGWSENPVDANLINAAGLPASPFRTDSW